MADGTYDLSDDYFCGVSASGVAETEGVAASTAALSLEFFTSALACVQAFEDPAAQQAFEELPAQALADEAEALFLQQALEALELQFGSAVSVELSAATAVFTGSCLTAA